MENVYCLLNPLSVNLAFFKENKKVSAFPIVLLMCGLFFSQTLLAQKDAPGKAAEFEYMRTKDPATGKVPRERLMEAIDNTQRAKSQAIRSRAQTVTWSERGPYTDVTGPSNGNTRANAGVTAGRVRAVWADLSDATQKTAWVGGVDGGLWKTTDVTAATPNWTLVNDFFSNLAVTGICQDPTNTSTLYFCTGEAYFNADRVRGNGVFKSTDGGATWTQLASTTAFYYCSKIVCDAAGNIYLGTIGISKGLQRSTDGGNTWTTITPTGLTTSITDVEISSTGRLHVCVGYYQTGGGYRFTDSPSTVTSATWTAPTTAFTYPSGTAARIELACLGNTLYAAPSNTGAVITQIYKSTDGGVTWATKTLTATNITDLNGSATSSQGWYCMGLDIDPSNANNVIVGNLRLLKSTDGGTTWAKISEWVGTTGQYVHADIQTIKWFDNGNKLLIGCDGGIHFSADKGTTFRDRNVNLRIKQFYSCAIHPTSTNYFLAGAQDNGTHQLNSAGLSSSVEVTGGDGAYVAIDQNEPQYQFGAYVYNQFRRSTNGGTSWSSINISGTTGKFINPWDYDNVNNKIYASNTAGNYLRWDNPQTGSTTVSVPITAIGTGSVSAVMVSPYTAHQVYFGTDAGRIVKVTNANATPTEANITVTGMTGYVNCVNVGTDDNNLIACFSNYGVNNIWVTTNGGTTWTTIDGNLPDMPVRWAMFYPGNNTKAYIATETGVWETDLINGASTVWTANTTFPTVRTDMLKYRASDGTIVAATHGRGLWSGLIPSNGVPSAPSVGTITQPTCSVATGSVVLNGLPSTGTWTLTRSPGAVTSTGSGVSTTISGLSPGTYTYTVTNTFGTSVASANVVINAVPTIPTTPSVGTITQPTCSVTTGSVVLSGLPATGTWTLTRSPGAVTTTGTGASATVTGIPTGTFTYTVTLSGCTSVASASVVINAVPGAPTAPSVGTITQPTCSVTTGSVVLSGLPATGTWTLTRSPGAVTTTGTGASATVTGIPAGTFTYTVTLSGCTSVASASVVINAVPGAPTAPIVGTRTQPTCAVPTGSVVLSGLPTTGTWTLTRSPGAVTTTGTGASATVTGILTGTYTYTVTLSGCTSVASASVVINAVPGAPTAPSVGTITQPTCSVTTGSVVLSGLPATGTWTLTRSPGAVTTTGTGASATVTGIPAGTFTYTVTLSGCTSVASASVVINAVPTAPTAPSVGTITQPTCAVTTGSVVLSGLPATGTWTLTRSPGAVTTTGTGASATVTGIPSGTFTYTVTLSGCTSVASASVVINAVPTAPTAPIVGTRTQPTCAVPTGSVVLSGLPTTGTWTLTRSPGAVTTTGTGASATVTGIPAGTFTYTVTLSGCTSVASASVVINAVPTAPTAPVVGTRTQPTCTVTTGSVVLSGLPATGTWALTRSPGAVTTTGTGTSATVTGIPAGTYTYTVTLSGCTSVASASVVINAVPTAPTAPSVGTVTQPTCAVTTGSVVLSGLPATGTWTLTRSPGAVTTTGTGASTTISGLSPGTYTYTVRNSVACTSVASASFTLTAATGCCTLPTISSVTKTTSKCTNGTITINATGIGALEYSINNGTTYQTAALFTGLAAGSYTVKVRLQATPTCVTTYASNPVAITTATNTLPTITMTSPTNNSTWTNTVNFAATAADADGTISQVNFYRVVGLTSTLLGSDNTSPYTFAWTGMTAGTYTVRAQAVDNCGGTRNSSSTRITVAITAITNSGSSSVDIGNTIDLNTAVENTKLMLSLSPNPAHQEVVLTTDIPKAGDYRITMIDAIGKIVHVKNGIYTQGKNIENWDISTMPKGLYFIRLAETTGIEYAVQKLIVD